MNAKLIFNKIQQPYNMIHKEHGTDYDFKTDVLKSMSKKEGKKFNH